MVKYKTMVKYILFQNVSERKLKKEYAISSVPSSAPHLERWALKITWVQRLPNPTNAPWKNLILYQLDLELNPNQGLALFRKTQMLRPIRHKNLQKQNNEDFFIQLFNTWLHFTNNKFPTSKHTEEILDQPIF